MSFAELWDWLICRVRGHVEDRDLYQHHGYDPDIGGYTRWVVKCHRCQCVIVHGTTPDEQPWG